MTPDDLRTVLASWSDLSQQRRALLPKLTHHYEQVGVPIGDAAVRASWLVCAVGELVELLPAPSQLASRARALGETWPDPRTAPSFEVDGRAWLAAADECLPTWSEATADAWRQAWLLLSDELAAEALSPFAGNGPHPRPTAGSGTGPDPGGAVTGTDADASEEGDTRAPTP